MDGGSLAQLIDQSAGALKGSALDNIASIHRITMEARFLAMNALIEAKRVGDKGAGFSVVAGEVKSIADEVEQLAKSLGSDLVIRIDELRGAVNRFTLDSQSTRLIDLSLNAVEIIDRNLYERTCDVRWWATDAAVVDGATQPTVASIAHAEQRLGVILSSYTVYLDLWLCDLQGRVIANGRPDRFKAKGTNVSALPWFKKARSLVSGDAYTAADIAHCDALNGAQVATYVAQVRENGANNGRVVGLLAVHFDWAPQASGVVEGVRLTPEEAPRSRVMLLDANRLVIAASDGQGILREQFPLKVEGKKAGSYIDDTGRRVAFHATPGYETYGGLGWYGVITQAPDLRGSGA